MPNRFFIPIACRNAETTIRRCLDSIINQTHSDFNVVLVDDASTDNTADIAKKHVGSDSRFLVFRNQTRCFALRNIVESVWTYAPNDAIIATIDGDDALSDSDALSSISKEYDRTSSDALWTQYSASDGSKCICGPMRGSPLTCPWTMSHLRTFRKYLIHGIHPRLFINPELNIWWRYTYDQILYRPILSFAKKPVFFPRICYWYNVPSEDREYADIQKRNAELFHNLSFSSFSAAPKKVTFIINGPAGKSDTRFFYGEKRPPLGVLSMTSHLLIRGHKVDIIDRFATPKKEFIDACASADVVGVTLTTPNKEDGKQIISSVRSAFPKKYIVAGGPHTVLYPRSVLQAGANCACTGEADFSISDIVRETPSGFLDCGRIRNMDSLPIPAFHLVLGQKQYDWTWSYSAQGPIIPYASSRGCPHLCAFCQTRDIWGREYYVQSASRLSLDVEYMIRTFGIGGIYFREDNFGHDAKRVKRFCEHVISSGSKIQWACEIRADRAQEPGLLPLMAKAGCIGIYVGAEGGSDRMLIDVFHKGIRKKDIIACASIAKENGIQRTFSFIEKHPLELKSDIDEREQLITSINPEVVHRCEFRPKMMEEMGL